MSELFVKNQRRRHSVILSEIELLIKRQYQSKFKKKRRSSDADLVVIPNMDTSRLRTFDLLTTFVGFQTLSEGFNEELNEDSVEKIVDENQNENQNKVNLYHSKSTLFLIHGPLHVCFTKYF